MYKHHLLCLDPEGIWNHPYDLMSRIGWQVKEGKVKCKVQRISEMFMFPQHPENKGILTRMNGSFTSKPSWE